MSDSSNVNLEVLGSGLRTSFSLDDVSNEVVVSFLFPVIFVSLIDIDPLRCGPNHRCIHSCYHYL